MTHRTPPPGYATTQRAPFKPPTPCHVVLKRLFKLRPGQPVALPTDDFSSRRLYKSLSRLRKEGWTIRRANSGIRWLYVYVPPQERT